MKKAIILLFIVAMLPALAYPQTTKLIFGPMDGDNAGILYTYVNTTIGVDVWIRTDPGLCGIAGLHLPLSSKDDLIQSDSREGGELYFPFQYWDDISFLEPNDDPLHEGYTSQSLMGVCTLLGIPCDDIRLIDTDGEWWKIASFMMTTASEIEYDELYCDALIEGYEQYNNWGIALSDNCFGELDPSEYEVEFACLQFVQSCGEYVIGDFNGSGAFNVADVVDGYSRLKTGSPDPAITCECPAGSGEEWAVAMDVNNSCAFNVADIVIAVHKLLGAPIRLIPCAYCPPEGWEP
jgi:hypothetical protein